MQRQHASPPIHHPVPQRPVQVPQMQSPPPPSQSSDPYENPYTQPTPYGSQPQQQQQYGQFPAFGGGGGGGGAPAGPPGANFFTDPMTAQMGFSVARAAMAGSTDIAETYINRWLPNIKPFFAVTNLYVLKKLQIILVPWRHSPWSRHTTTRVSTTRPGEAELIYISPREGDTNAPDMYIPVMAFVTYILLSALLYGLSGTFHPELLGYTASYAVSSVIFELVGLRFGCYMVNVPVSRLLDLAAYSGYKFVGVTVSILATALIGRGWLSWVVFAYVYLANAFFLLRSLKYVLLPDIDSADGTANVYSTAPRQMRKRRTWFLFAYSYVVQAFFMLILTKGIGK